MERTETKQEKEPASLRFSFFAGPTAWALQLLIGYILATQACISGTKLWIYLISAAAALVALTSAVLAYRSWHAYSGKEGMLIDTEADVSRPEFVAVSGALLSTVFLLLILMTGGAMIFLNPCPIINQPLP